MVVEKCCLYHIYDVKFSMVGMMFRRHDSFVSDITPSTMLKLGDTVV
jgi:hypothetical protein